MRSEQEMYDLIVDIARKDDRIRAVIMNGSRANPKAPRDFFQDYDIVYLVTEILPFTRDSNWIKQFGKLMIMQMPDDMLDPPPSNDGSFTYLMQFTDGNRIDLTLYPIAEFKELEIDSLTLLLLDKDGAFKALRPPSDKDYLPSPPTAKSFFDCCNEYWWVCPYVAKGLWREELIYAKYMLDQVLREQLMKILTWHIGRQTQFSQNIGKLGKFLEKYLEPELWNMLEGTYADAGYDNSWEALFTMCKLFRRVAFHVADDFGFDYPYDDDSKVSAYLQHIRSLPKNAKEIY